MSSVLSTSSKRKSGQTPSEMLSRYFDKRYDRWVIKILPGTQYITRERNEMLTTTLGSCVSACVRDARTGFCGMNHFMLPGDEDCDWGGAGFSLRFGHFAMESLFNAFFSTGSRKEDLIVKLFGGGNVIESSQMIGDNNARFSLDYMSKEGIEVASHDLGGRYARRIHFYADSGKVQRKFVERSDERQDRVAKAEARYRSSLTRNESDKDSIELFDENED